MILQELRDFVRNVLDVDSSELTDTQVDTFLGEGFDRIVRRGRRWPFYQSTWTFTTTGAVQDYALSAITADTIAEIASVINPTGNFGALEWAGNDDAEGAYFGTNAQSGPPMRWTIWGSKLRLFPKPDNAYTLRLTGYREPIDWVALGAGSIPDCPTQFHKAIAYFGLSGAYSAQEDAEMSQLWASRADSLVAELTDDLLARKGQSRPIIINSGAGPTMSFQSWYKSLVYGVQ